MKGISRPPTCKQIDVFGTSWDPSSRIPRSLVIDRKIGPRCYTFGAVGNDAFPDQHSAIEDLVAEGDRVVCPYSFRATHQRDFRGIPATGKQTTGTAVAIYRIVGGKIQEEWHYSHVEA